MAEIKILVTGSNGQLGYELRQAAKNYPQWEFLFTDVEELDITSRSRTIMFIETHSPQFIINSAAYTAVDKAEDEIEAAQLVNADAVSNLVAAAHMANARLLHISTDYVFDGKKTSPYQETDEVNPLSVYGSTKLNGERAVMLYDKGFVVRTSWLYSSTGNNFVRTMLRLGTERKSLHVVSDQTGSPTYAADLASALLQMIDGIIAQPKRCSAGIYHYANTGSCSWYTFAKQIMSEGQRDCTVEPCTTAEYPTKAYRPQCSILDTNKIKQTFGIEIPKWDEALKRCFKKINLN